LTNALIIGPKNTIVWLPMKFNGFTISKKKIEGVISFNPTILLASFDRKALSELVNI
jgi:hypothetical protein